ncbi:MAG: hypothetical protein Q3983_02600 [Capnocytophaga sp.]|nr:hypothetical protein [Capnocytophaga sp.]
MRNLKTIFAVATAGILTFTSCKKDDDNNGTTPNEEKGTVELHFDNVYKTVGNSIKLATNDNKTSVGTELVSSNNQKHKFEVLKYIISDVSLVTKDGKEVQYNHGNPNKGAQIINQAEEHSHHFNLSDIPVGEYSKVKFLIGISEEVFKKGENFQKDFFDKTTKEGMNWKWKNGYRHLRFEGFYGDDYASAFKLHLGDKVASANSQSISGAIQIELPITAVLKVEKDKKSAIHIKVDLDKYLSGTKKITLTSDNNNIHSVVGADDFVENIKGGMFSVDHLH